MGLYDVGFLFCLALYNLARWSPVFLGVYSSISLVISSGHVALLYIFFSVSVISISVMGVVSVLDFCRLLRFIV